MNAKHTFKPVVADSTLEARVVLSTVTPHAAIGVINTPVYFNPTQNQVKDGNPLSPVAFGMTTPSRTNAGNNTPSYFNPTQNQVKDSNPRLPIPFGGLPRPPVTGGSGFAGSGANSGHGVGRGNNLYI